MSVRADTALFCASMLHGENAKEGRPASEDMRLLRAALCLAQEMGAGLGRCEILLRALQARPRGH